MLIVHGNGWFTLCGHLSHFGIQDGQVVNGGDMIGQAGFSGFSTGPHLHFEVRFEGQYADPCAFLHC